MNITLCKAVLLISVLAWSVGSSGCASAPVVRKASPSPGAPVLFDAEARPAAIEMLIDAETFTAFCDRA